jgi:hypothetical protein
MRPRVRNGGAGAGDGNGNGALRWPEELSPGPSSVGRWRCLTIMAPGHIIILARIMLLRRSAITLRVMVLHQVGTRSPTACNASGRTIQGAELISGQMAIAIHALDHGKTVTCKLAMNGLIGQKRSRRAGRHLPIKMRSGPGRAAELKRADINPGSSVIVVVLRDHDQVAFGFLGDSTKTRP